MLLKVKYIQNTIKRRDLISRYSLKSEISGRMSFETFSSTMVRNYNLDNCVLSIREVTANLKNYEHLSSKLSRRLVHRIAGKGTLKKYLKLVVSLSVTQLDAHQNVKAMDYFKTEQMSKMYALSLDHGDISLINT